MVKRSVLNMNVMLCSHYCTLHFALTTLCFWEEGVKCSILNTKYYSENKA